ncbi:MAG: hypothetical protein QM784_07205 [Polyangiaceae bacterium]
MRLSSMRPISDWGWWMEFIQCTAESWMGVSGNCTHHCTIGEMNGVLFMLDVFSGMFVFGYTIQLVDAFWKRLETWVCFSVRLARLQCLW